MYNDKKRGFKAYLPTWYVAAFGASIGIMILRYPESIIYKGMMPLMRLLDPENASKLAIFLAQYSPITPVDRSNDPVLKISLWGREFKNPVGLAAGFDKHGEAYKTLLKMGFGFVEIGSITPKAQPGNLKPRVFRLLEDNAIINRYGFNSDGADVVLSRINKRQKDVNTISLGINLGKNKDSIGIDDYLNGIKTLGPYADYLVINVSSPNTPNLRICNVNRSYIIYYKKQ